MRCRKIMRCTVICTHPNLAACLSGSCVRCLSICVRKSHLWWRKVLWLDATWHAQSGAQVLWMTHVWRTWHECTECYWNSLSLPSKTQSGINKIQIICTKSQYVHSFITLPTLYLSGATDDMTCPDKTQTYTDTHHSLSESHRGVVSLINRNVHVFGLKRQCH